jgi:isoleucyl-tRNA synthetase
MKFRSQETESIHLAEMPKVDDSIDFKSSEQRWQKLMELRDEVLRVLEVLRKEKKIASNQQACVNIYCADEELAGLVQEFGPEQFAALCIVSEVKLPPRLLVEDKSGGQTSVAAEKSSYNKCQRCWNYWPSVGADSEHPDLCKRCVEAVRSC